MPRLPADGSQALANILRPQDGLIGGNYLNIGNKNSITLKFYLNNIYNNNVYKSIVDDSEVPIPTII